MHRFNIYRNRRNYSLCVVVIDFEIDRQWEVQGVNTEEAARYKVISFLFIASTLHCILVIPSSQCSCKFILYPTKTSSNMMASTCYLPACREHQDRRTHSNKSGKVEHAWSARCHVVLFSQLSLFKQTVFLFLSASGSLTGPSFSSSPCTPLLVLIDFLSFCVILLILCAQCVYPHFTDFVLHFGSHRNQVQPASGSEDGAPL